MMNDVPFLRHVTSNKTFANFVPIDLKIGTHIGRTYTMYHAKNAPIKIT